MNGRDVYQVQTFNLSGLAGISDRTLEMHFKLYQGYVNETPTSTGAPSTLAGRHLASRARA